MENGAYLNISKAHAWKPASSAQYKIYRGEHPE
jgi:hypothetical protein